MSKGKWMKEVCKCTKCKNCRSRAHMQAKRDGTWTRYQPKGRKRDEVSKAKKEAKRAFKAVLEADKQAHKADKVRQKKWREHRNKAFKYNLKRYGLKKAKFIAVIVR